MRCQVNNRYVFPAALLVLCVMLPAMLCGQRSARKQTVPVYSSPKGMYVFCGMTIASAAHPAGDTVGYRIERKTGRESWKKIADIGGVDSWEAFRSRVGDSVLTRIAKAMKAPSNAAIWDTIVAKPSLHRVPFISSLHAMLALGNLYLDADVKKGVKYEYRVSTLLRSGAAVFPRASEAEEFGAPWRIASMRVLKKEETDSSVMIEWMAPEVKPWPRYFLIYRRFSGQEDWRLLPKYGAMNKRHDTLVCTLFDKGLIRNQEYEYYVVPVDFVENQGPVSEIATVYALNFSRLPLPQNMKARPDSGGIRLSWRTRGLDLVMATRIYRSMHFDSGFVRIAEVPATDTMYMDETARGMIRYYYRLTNVSYRNHESRRSATIFGYWKSPLPPVAPQDVRARGVDRGVEVSWTKNKEEDIAGYYVYRSHLVSDSVGIVVSPLLEESRFLDTSGTLRGDTEYKYSVVALSTSQVRSARSLEARARPLIKLSPKPPRNLSARVLGETIALTWNDPREYDESVMGYVIYRASRDEKTAEYKTIGRIAFDPESVNWVDSSAKPGVKYVYAVSSVDGYGYEGIRSAGAECMIRIVLPEPPALIHASRSEGGVLVEWDPVGDESVTSYAIYRNERGREPEKLTTIKTKELVYADRKVRKGAVYYYSVSSIDVKGREGRRSEAAYVVP